MRPQHCLLLLTLAAAAGGYGCHTSPEAREAKFLKRGEALLAKKEYTKAMLEFRNAATAMPKDAEPFYRLGLAYLATGDGVNALRALHQATELNPNHKDAQLKLAQLMTVSRYPKYLQEAAARLESTFGDSPSNPEVMDTLAMAEWKLGKSDDATQRLEDALKRFPGHTQSSIELAQMKVAAKDWDAAERVLKQAVADSPKAPQAEVALGELYNLHGQPEKAEAEMQKALALDPQNGQALLGLAAIQIAAKRMDDAEKTYRKIAALPGPNYRPMHAAFLYRSGKRAEAVSELAQLATANPDDRAIRSLLVAGYLGVNRTADAENTLAAALKRNPKDTEALLQRGELRLKAGRAQEAEKDLSQALQFRTDSAPVHFALAQAYRMEGRQGMQQSELQQALKINPSLLSARLSLESIYLSERQGKAALDAIESAPEAQKKTVAWNVGRNWALLSMGNLKDAQAGIDAALNAGRPAEALYQHGALSYLEHNAAAAEADMEELLQRDPTNLQAAELYMQAAELSGQRGKGVERLNRLVSTHPDSAPLLQLLGVAYQRAGDGAQARTMFERAKTADAHFAPASLSLADLAIREGKIGEAQNELHGVLAQDPRNVSALLLTASAGEKAGDRAAAVAGYRSVLNIDGSNLVALNNLAYDLALDDPDEALKFGEKAAELAPGSANVADTLGWIYYRKGLYSMSARYLKTAVDTEATPRREFHLAMSYIKTGDRVAGQKMLQDALQKDPNLVRTEQGW